MLECAAVEDVLVVSVRLNWTGWQSRSAGLTRLGKRGYSLQEESTGYGVDVDSDFDSDSDERKSQPEAALNADKPSE